MLVGLQPTAPWLAVSARGPSPRNPHNPGDRRSASFRPACPLATLRRIVCRPCGQLRHGSQYLPGGRAPGTPPTPVTAAQLASARHAPLPLLGALFAGPAAN